MPGSQWTMKSFSTGQFYGWSPGNPVESGSLVLSQLFKERVLMDSLLEIINALM